MQDPLEGELEILSLLSIYTNLVKCFCNGTFNNVYMMNT